MIGILKYIFLAICIDTLKCFPSGTDSSQDFSQKCLEEFRKTSLEKHNEFRKKHNAPSLLRDSFIEESAQNYANELAITNDLVYSENRDNIGENLFAKDSNGNLDEELTLDFCKLFAEECVNIW